MMGKTRGQPPKDQTAAKLRSLMLSAKSVASERAKRRKELAVQIARARKVLKHHAARLRRRTGVTGLDVGLKFKDHRLYRPLTYVIRVHVQAKRSGELLSKRSALPDRIDGVEVDVLERPYVSLAGIVIPASASGFQQLCNPVRGGCSITGDGGASVGTLGMVVNDQNGQPVYLTNQHVALAPGNQVWQPGLSGPGVPTNKQRIIGVVAQVSQDAFVDCATIAPDTANRPLLFEILGLPANSQFVAGKLGVDDEQVTFAFKIGAATGSNPIIWGIVDNTDTEFVDDQGDRFINQISVLSVSGDVICAPGDSGAVLLTRQSSAPPTFAVMGLVHGSTLNGDIAIASHFDAVAGSLNISV